MAGIDGKFFPVTKRHFISEMPFCFQDVEVKYANQTMSFPRMKSMISAWGTAVAVSSRLP
jgi:hypothetical protein